MKQKTSVKVSGGTQTGLSFSRAEFVSHPSFPELKPVISVPKLTKRQTKSFPKPNTLFVPKHPNVTYVV